MTAKEQRAFRKLEIRIEELERHFKISQQHCIDTFRDLFETRTALRQAYDTICEAEKMLREALRNDPAYKVEKADIVHL